MNSSLKLPVLLLVLLSVACGGGNPAGPAPTSGATLAGFVGMGGAAPKGVNALAGPPAAGMTVSIDDTSLSTTTNASGYFEISGVPSGTVKLQFRQSAVNASAQLTGVQAQQLVEIEVQVTGTTATIVGDTRSEGKLSICHRTEGVNGYHLITVGTSAEPAHRGHGDAKVGERVPGTQLQTFGENCQVVGPAVEIVKSTNGEDANNAPGPSIVVGQTVSWDYVVRNTGTVTLTGIAVTDNRGVSVTCPATAASLPAGQSMTCTGHGVATLGQYSNIGTVTANSTAGQVTDTDVSHYRGIQPTEEEGQKVELCHRTGNGSYHLISVGVAAEPAHLAHGDGKPGQPVPNGSGRFSASCLIQ